MAAVFVNSISSWTRDHMKLIVAQFLKKFLPVVILYRDRNLKKLVVAEKFHLWNHEVHTLFT